MPDVATKGEKIFTGIPVSGGVCRGRVVVLTGRAAHVTKRELEESQVPGEMKRLEQALLDTRNQILEVQKKVSLSMGSKEESIFDAHLLVLEDRTLLEEVTRNIQQNRLNADYAFHIVAEKYAKALSQIEDDYLRERAADMRDVSNRILNNLSGHQDEVDLRSIKDPCIIVSQDLTPSMTAQIDRKLVLGFATDSGGRTSHTAIMARSMRIPAAVGMKNLTGELQTGQYVLLDGFNGIVILNPTDATLFEYGQIIRNHESLEEKLRDLHGKPAVTLDGHHVILSANVEKSDDWADVLSYGAEGVGLFRTEYLFTNETELPGEDRQCEAYKKIAAGLAPHPVVIRTFDLGGDKNVPMLNMPVEANPFLGWRAIRYCLQEEELFKTQLRAILRASAMGKVRMMYPMISGLDELKQANAFLEQCKNDLRERQIPFDENIEVGAMIEIPSAVMVADALAKRLKFLSLGTNDLIQYTLAVDRLNERVAHLYEPTNPAIVRMIKMTVEAGRRHGVLVSVCGEMAGDPVLTPLLLGLGVDELSVTPSLVPQVKFIIRKLKMGEARELAEFALESESGSQILERCKKLAMSIAPSLFEAKA